MNKYNQLLNYIEKNLQEIEVKGLNMGLIEKTNFNPLTRYEVFVNPFYTFEPNDEQRKLISIVQIIYLQAVISSEKSHIAPMVIDENGKVDIKPGKIYRREATGINHLKNISVGGVLASEWFGNLESSQEGAFCTFVSKYSDYKRLPLEAEPSDEYIRVYFDETNPLMQQLLSYDFFEYEKRKIELQSEIEDSEKIIEELRTRYKYPRGLINIFNKLIEPVSNDSDFVTRYNNRFNCREFYWKAIPGGIPSCLINGICISSNDTLMKKVDELSSYFPNATIFDENRTVILEPQKKRIEYEKKETSQSQDQH